MENFIYHLHRVRSTRLEPPTTCFKKQFRQFEDEMLAKYEHMAFYFCNDCEGP